MWKVSIKGLWARKRRLLGTCVAVLLGVAFLAGTLVLGDTMRGGFGEVFTEANSGTDAVVRGSVKLGNDESSIQRQLVPASLLTQIEAVDGIEAAALSIEGLGQITAADGTTIGGDGPPTFAVNWIDDPELNAWQIAEGRPPERSGEVVIDKQSSETGDLPVGSTTTIRTPAPIEVVVVGIATFGDADSISGSSATAFTLEEAQQVLLGGQDAATDIVVRGADGLSQAELAGRIAPVLPPGLEVITGDELTNEQLRDIEADFLAIFENLLLVFTGIALLVAAFSIYNTFSVVLAQRTRESALLRALGASRGQVLRSIALEALVVGAVASLGGLVAGIALAFGLQSLLEAAGLGLPGGLVVGPRSVVTAVVVGMVVTVLASVLPALRASSVPPLAALRDVAVERTDASPVRVAIGILLAGGGIVVVLYAAATQGGSALATVGLGAILTLVGMVVLGPLAARPAARVLGTPLARLRGTPGALAQQNAMRNPKRTASTASALMVGVAVVALFTVMASSVKATVDESVSTTFAGDLVISTTEFSGAGLSPQLAVEIDSLDVVADAAGIGPGVALVDGEERSLLVSDPAKLGRVLDLDVTEGSLDAVTTDSLAVPRSTADAEGWTTGSLVVVTFADGESEEMEIVAVYEGNAIVAGSLLMTPGTWAAHAVQPFDRSVLVALEPGVSIDEGRAAVDEVGASFGAPAAQDRDEYVESIAGQIDVLLNVVYVLLALSILIALMGIANTLSLSIHERVRELGLLRAVGETRGQMRSMVRWESVVIALFGTLGGLVLGLFLAWGLVRAVTIDGGTTAFAVPPGQLVVVLLVGAAAGVLAGVRPARRAARLDVLRAITAD